MGTRPDIAFAISYAGRRMANPTHSDLVNIKRIFRYLAGTLNYSLIYRRTDKLNITGYSDSDWAGDLETRRSTTGHAFMLAGAAIS